MNSAPEPYGAAVAAFDAGNLAWGRFRHEALPAHPSAATAVADEIRDALGEAALAAAELREGAPPDEFRTALATALDLLDRYRDGIRPEVPRADLDAAFDLLREALAALGA